MLQELPPELMELKKLAREYVDRRLLPAEAELNRTGQVPQEILDEMKEMGFYGLTIPVEYGGMSLSLLGFCLVTEELARAHGGFLEEYLLATGIGGRPLVLAGTPQQKQKYLPAVASGEIVTAFALTEPNAGSDAANIRTRAERRGDRWVINGNKIFITNAPRADLFTVMAVTDPVRRAHGGVTAFLVEKGTPGLQVAQVFRTMGSDPQAQAEIVFEDVAVSDEQVLGGVGNGFKVAMQTLDEGRLKIAAFCIGNGQRALELARDYALQREAFGRPIAEFQAIQFMLADSDTELFAARSMLHAAAARLDRGEQISKECSEVKLFASEMVGRVVDRSLQIHGGMGVMSDSAISRLYRDVRGYRIVDGTSEIQRLNIARHLLKER